MKRAWIGTVVLAVFLLSGSMLLAAPKAHADSLFWSSDFETGDLSKFAGVHTGMPTWGNSSATVVPQGGTISGLNNDGPWTAPAPHNGTYAVGLLVDGPATDVGSAGGQRAELTSGYYDSVGTERYYGLSVYIPSSPNGTNTSNNAIWQTGWGTSLSLKTSGYNDPTGDSNSFQIANNAADSSQKNGWSAAWYHVAPILYDQWVNFTIHVYWATDSTGYFEVYENGQLVTLQGLSYTFSGTRVNGSNYGVASQMDSEFDWYRNAQAYPNLLYLDDLKIGDSYAIVQPTTIFSAAASSGTITSPFAVRTATDGTQYVSQTTDTSSGGPGQGGKAVYTFSVPTSGNYVVWMTIEAANLSSNSVYVNIDADPALVSGAEPNEVWDTPLVSSFTQESVDWRGNGTPTADQFVPKVFTLSAGGHTLYIRGREANTKFSHISIVSA